jgi:hypothetical protein
LVDKLIFSRLENDFNKMSTVFASIDIPNALAANVEFQQAELFQFSGPGPTKISGGAHLIQIEFRLPENFHGGEIKQINSISIKMVGDDQPTKLVTNSINRGCKNTLKKECSSGERLFYIYLAHDPKTRSLNIWNLRVASFFEISLIFADDQSGTLVFENTKAGKSAFDTALRDWDDWLKMHPNEPMGIY